jgi:hypothetical protein
MRKVIFLDIDGVLSPRWWDSNKQSDNYGCLFDAKAVANFAKIIEKTDAQIVVSSSWKLMGFQALQDMWKGRKLPGKIIDITPDYMSDELLMKEDSTNVDYLFERGSEVQGWLLLHGDDVSRYVIIDDMDDILPEQQSHFVQTDPEVGITEEDANIAIKILNA